MKITYKGWDCTIAFGKYASDRTTAISLYHAEEKDLVAVATVCVDENPGDNCV